MDSKNGVAVVVENNGWPDALADLAISKVDFLTKFIQRPALFGQLRLFHHSWDRKPFAASLNVDGNGTTLYARSVGPSPELAIQGLEQRFHAEIERTTKRNESKRLRRRGSSHGEWHHGDIPAKRPNYWPRSTDEREMFSHPTFSFPVNVEDAIEEMLSDEFEFNLFTDPDTGTDSVVYLGEDGEIHLSRSIALEPEMGDDIYQPRLDPSVAPPLNVDDAIERLDTSNEPFVFFLDESTDRGAVLYHRYDGNLGLVTAG